VLHNASTQFARRRGGEFGFSGRGRDRDRDRSHDACAAGPAPIISRRSNTRVPPRQPARTRPVNRSGPSRLRRHCPRKRASSTHPASFRMNAALDPTDMITGGPAFAGLRLFKFGPARIRLPTTPRPKIGLFASAPSIHRTSPSRPPPLPPLTRLSSIGSCGLGRSPQSVKEYPAAGGCFRWRAYSPAARALTRHPSNRHHVDSSRARRAYLRQRSPTW